MRRRSFLLAGASLALVRETEDLREAGIAEIRERLAAGRATAVSIAQWYLARIAELDGKLKSVIEVNPDALAAAGGLDRELKEKGPRGPLHGVPVLVKDNIDTAGRIETTAGSLALAGSKPARDAFIVSRLRAAGAVILGTTNLSEWANFRSSHSVSGWSGRGGQTRNPYALDRNPSGSSSGSAVAVAANLCAVAVGTETDGSVVSPASVNGVVGIKPTLGLASRRGIVPIAHSQDTAGPMARSVRDAAVLLGVLAGADPGDEATAAAAAQAQADYTKFLDPRGLRGARLGVARKFFEGNAVMNRLLDDWVRVLKTEGAEVIDPADLPSHGKWSDPEFEVLLYEFKVDLNAYLSRRGPAAPAHSLAEVIAFDEKHRREEMPYFEQEIMQQAEKKGPLTEKPYLEALANCRRLSRDEGIDAVVGKHRLDAIVAPTNGPAWLIDWVNGDQDTGGCSTPAAMAGYPHITVPAGWVRGLPVGLSFFGPAWSEPVLLRLAYAFEQATRARRQPGLTGTVEFSG
jgi:amidase